MYHPHFFLSQVFDGDKQACYMYFAINIYNRIIWRHTIKRDTNQYIYTGKICSIKIEIPIDLYPSYKIHWQILLLFLHY